MQQNHNFTDKHGIKLYELVFEVSDFELLDKKEETEKRMQNEQQQSVHPSNHHEQPSIDEMNQYGSNTNS